MSIQSEITRIAGNVSDALAEIANKGVTVPVGSNSDDLATLIAQITGGGGSAIVITDTIDPVSGGTIRTITAVDISGDTVTASDMLYGVTAHDASGTAVTGNIVTKTQADLSASGDTVTAPAGYYASSASKSVASGSAATPATTITATPTISVNSSTGVITASVSASQSVTPTVSAGYVSTGTAGTITASGSDTEQLSVQAGTTITPTESQQVAVAAGKYTTGAVNVGAISSTYVGSGIDRNDSTDLSVSGATVQVPKGYYESNASKAVANGSVTAPSTISGTGATVSTGTNTLTLSKTVSVTPSVTAAGYVSGGTAGNSSVSLTANVTTQAAQTIHPSTSDQTISSGRYLTGNQTIKAVTVSGLSASNILSGVTVKIGDSTDDDCVASVSGSVSFQTIYSGSSAPSAAQGVDGDIYIQT